jgi:hypothetical protein
MHKKIKASVAGKTARSLMQVTEVTCVDHGCHVSVDGAPDEALKVNEAQELRVLNVLTSNITCHSDKTKSESAGEACEH